jgi:hypothetical protein
MVDLDLPQYVFICSVFSEHLRAANGKRTCANEADLLVGLECISSSVSDHEGTATKSTL